MHAIFSIGLLLNLCAVHINSIFGTKTTVPFLFIQTLLQPIIIIKFYSLTCAICNGVNTAPGPV